MNNRKKTLKNLLNKTFTAYRKNRIILYCILLSEEIKKPTMTPMFFTLDLRFHSKLKGIFLNMRNYFNSTANSVRKNSYMITTYRYI